MVVRASRGISVVVASAVAVTGQSPMRLADLHRVLPTAESAISTAKTADIDNDGVPDIFFIGVGRELDRSGVWRGIGNGRFEDIAGAIPLMPYHTSVALADLDGDGDLDFAAATLAYCTSVTGRCSGGTDFVMWNDGTGHFSPNGPVLPSDPSAFSECVAAGDIDGDGDKDLVFGCIPLVTSIFNYPNPPSYTVQYGENWLFLNNGSGVFTADNARLGNAQDWTAVMLLRDFDGDGDLDLFCGNNFAAIISPQDAYYRNDGTGHFTRIANALPVDNDDALAAFAMDADNDADLDIVVHTSQGLRLLRNNAGTFVDATASVAPPPGPIHRVFVADVDGDGDIDLGVRSFNVVHQLRNAGNGSFAHFPAADRSPTVGIELCTDLDGDGDADLALHGGNLDHTIWLNDGTGAWTQVPATMPPSLANQFGPSAVDIDLDGDLDVLTCAELSPNAVYRNDGSGRFSAVSFGDFTLDVDASEGLAVGDLDGDGWPDAVVANESFGPAPSRAYRNDTAGRLQRVALPPVTALSVALGDVDGDGDLDIWFGRQGVDEVLRNVGGMTFATIPGAVTGNTRTSAVALGDVDADGDLDAVCVGSYGAGNRVLRNNGTGMFTVMSGALPNHLENSHDVELADFDGDGDLDIVVANDGAAMLQTQPNRFYRNNGNGIFTDSSQDLPGRAERTNGISAADIDADGDLDLLEAQFLASPVSRSRLLANDGLGHFTVVTDGLAATTGLAHDFITGDFDRDGDLDAFLATQGTPRMFWNLRHQLTWRELPRLGRPLTMDLFGQAAEPFAFVASPVRIELPVAPFGVLQVDIGSALVLELGALDAQGRAARSYAVPANAAFLGVDIYWQAVTGNSPRLGNLEITKLIGN